jgi:hypothetical protein
VGDLMENIRQIGRGLKVKKERPKDKCPYCGATMVMPTGFGQKAYCKFCREYIDV